MSFPAEVAGLVERFDRNRDEYMSGTFNETRVRVEFIDPLVKALGWDVHNRQGQPEAYRDVIHEDRVKIGGGTKAPDYGFYVGGNRKFFLEAKKPSVDIRGDVNPAVQLRRYAWSAKLPLSILTDFQEFAVYDCRFEPTKEDKPETALVDFFTYDQYEECWDAISSRFSREAVLNGSLDQYAEESKHKRGTRPVDAAFLKEIESWRSTLAKDLAARNDLNQRQLNYAVQMLIDRLIFLRMTEDRGVEDYQRLYNVVEGAEVYRRLCDVFKDADNRYNSGLFHFQNERGREEEPDRLTLDLDVDDRLLRKIVRGLYYPESPYEFSVLPVDVLGQVYEQFLGSVIRLEGGYDAVVEQKPEVRKAGGVYYTPTYIVDYIVERTVGRLLEDKRPGPRGGASRIKIVDPACGSGSFLIGAYRYLLDWHRDRYLEDGPEKWTKQLYQGQGNQWYLTIEEKKRILLNNIYGIDIDPQAVEVTKLSLLLKVLEGESDGSLTRQLALIQERALPDLDNNIKCGNSLVGPDFYDDEQMSLLDEEEHYRINVFDWENAFPQVFDGENSGFNVVIGNPPYGAYIYELEKAYLASKYTHQSYQLDSYLLFLEQALENTLGRGGFYGMIIPNPWLTNLLQSNIRKLVVEKTRVQEIVHFLFPVFPKVTVDTEILILRKAPQAQQQTLVTIVQSLKSFLVPSGDSENKQIQHDQQKWRDLNGGTINIFTSPAEEALATKCSTVSQLLNSLFDINVGIKPYQTGKGHPPQTREVVKSRPYDSDRPVDSSSRSYLRGKDIGRYKIAPLEPRYLKYGPWLAEPRPAANFDAPAKIVMRQTGDSLVAAIDLHQYLCLNNMHVLVPKETDVSPFYTLGVINSRLLNWYYRTLNPEVGEALAEVKKANVAKLPIYAVDLSNYEDVVRHDRMVGLVEVMLSLHESLAKARIERERTTLGYRITAIERQIDQLVYDLYGLTDEETALVDGATAR